MVGKQASQGKQRRSVAELEAELERRTAERDEAQAERDEALTQQTATAEVLSVVSGSTFDLQQVLQTVLETAVRLCHADGSEIWRLQDGVYRYAVGHDQHPGYVAREEHERTISAGRGTLVGHVADEGQAVHIHDAWADPLYELKDAARAGDYRTMLGVPLLRDGAVIGVIALSRRSPVRPFSDAEVELVKTFAAQAVIAIENARLITETREALEQQTATAEVLGVINSSPGDLVPVFDALLEKALHLCGAAFGILRTYDGKRFHTAATRGVPEIYAEFLRTNPQLAAPGSWRTGCACPRPEGRGCLPGARATPACLSRLGWRSYYRCRSAHQG
jgi:transcriptional regulator with GAF, ATPase, and Fis domain